MIKIAPLFGYIGLFLIKKWHIYNQSLCPCCAQRGTQRVILLGAFINCIKIFERGLHPFKEKLLESSTIFDYSYFIYNSGMIHKAHNKIFHSKINAKSKENQNKIRAWSWTKILLIPIMNMIWIVVDCSILQLFAVIFVVHRDFVPLVRL